MPPSLIIISLTTGPMNANTLYVPSQYPTIQQALHASRDGDTILVASGVYVESLTFDGKNVSVLSETGPAFTRITSKER